VSPPKLPEVPKNKWKPRHHIGIYDYNYKVGESYYTPQTKYIHKRPAETLTHTEKPPESQTYAERFASCPIYGSARGLPYDASQSVFRQPVATHTVGTRGRGSSLTRDSGVSQYLSSLGSHDPFSRADSKLSRQLAEPQPYKPKTKTTDDWADSRRVTSLPPSKKRLDDKVADYKQLDRPIPKWQPNHSSSLTDISRARKPSFSDVTKPPLNLRSRRSSIGAPESSSSLERRAKDEITSIAYGHNSRDEAPRYRSSQYFRDARRQQESEDINRMVDNLRHSSWASSRPSRASLRH